MGKKKVKTRGVSFSYDFFRDGVTTGLLSQFLECRFKADYYLDGWATRAMKFYFTFGNVVHGTLESVNLKMQAGKYSKPPSKASVLKHLAKTERLWRQENRRASKKSIEDFELCLGYAEAIVPAYYRYWWDDFKTMEWLGVEKEFSIPWKLRDGKRTRFRGKRDGEFIYKPDGNLWLFETKTSSQVREQDLLDTLELNFQLRNYCVSLRHQTGDWPSGAWYNLVRRPGLRQKQTESTKEFIDRIAADVDDRPEHYFKRIEVPLDPIDLREHEKFMDNTIHDFYDWWRGMGNHYPNLTACRAAYGVCDFAKACKGEVMKLNYMRRDKLFSELED
jgi:hypothetical protein